MKTNLYRAPITYRELGKAKPVKEGSAPAPPRTMRVEVCLECRRGGGTLRNIGSHKEPRYIHPVPCQRQRDQRLAIRSRMRNSNHA